jgi:hypothetical protein
VLDAVVKFRQQHHAFLFVRICSSDDGYTVINITQIVGHVRDIGGNVNKVSGMGDEMTFQLVAVPHARFTAQNINRGFVTSVLMGLAPRAGWDGRDLQVDSACAHRLSGDAGRVHVSVLAGKLPPSGKDTAGWCAIGWNGMCVGHLLRLLLSKGSLARSPQDVGKYKDSVMYVRAVWNWTIGSHLGDCAATSLGAHLGDGQPAAAPDRKFRFG